MKKIILGMFLMFSFLNADNKNIQVSIECKYSFDELMKNLKYFETVVELDGVVNKEDVYQRHEIRQLKDNYINLVSNCPKKMTDKLPTVIQRSKVLIQMFK